MTHDHLASSGERKAAIVGPARPVGEAAGISLMLLRLGTRWFAVEAHAVVEVALKGAVTRVPTAPNHIMGIASLRGRLITVVSLEQMLGGAGLLSSESTATLPRLVVVRHGDYEMALVAESIHGVGEHQRPRRPDDDLNHALPGFVREEFLWQGHWVALLDIPQLVVLAAQLSGIHSPSELVEA
jgi:chemotaxis signal transduction protein